MFVQQLREAAVSAPDAGLPAVRAALWKAFDAGQISEADAEGIERLIEARKMTQAARAPVSGIVRPNTLFPPRKPQRPPERSVAIERRRRLAASGPMPPALAARFTTSEAAVMRIVGDECREKGRCVLPIDAIAARAGVGRTTVQNALRLARRLGMVEIEERRQTGARSLPNRVTVIDREWRQWLDRGPRGKGTGFKNVSTTDTSFLPEGWKADSSRENRNRRDWQRPRNQAKKDPHPVQGSVRDGERQAR